MGMNQYSRKWQRLTTYGGKLVENMTQAVARDVFKFCYPVALAAGYSIRLPIHDELITYAPDGELYNAKHLSQLMATNPGWAQGLPLAAAGFEAYRYRKG
jgi:DNA polymerase